MRSRRSLRHAPAIYFIRPVGMQGPVKIGTTISLDWRIIDLTAYSPLKLELWAAFPGAHKTERRFHQFFVEDHSHGEWFNWSQKMEETVQAILGGTFDVDTLPEGKRLSYSAKHSPPRLEIAA